MTDNDIDRTLAQWFEADAQAGPPAEIVSRALGGARRHRPRPRWSAIPGSHWGWNEPRPEAGSGVLVVPGSKVRWSTAIVLMAILAALVAGAAFVGARLLERPSPVLQRLGHLAYAVGGDIFIADWDGQNPVRIADGLPGSKSGCGSAGYWAEGPMWSPDGQHLAYRSPRSQVDCSRPEADTYPTVQISDPAGNIVASVPGVGWLIPWSPDSTRVATWLDLYPMTRIGVYGLDGELQATVTLPPSLSEGMVGDHDPAWSPDGQSLLIPISGQQGAMTVWELPLDGSPPRLVSAEDARSHWLIRPSWDGDQVAYIENDDIGSRESGSLVVAAADGSQPRVVASDVNRWWGPGFAWSSSGDRIAFVAGGKLDVEPQDLSGMELRVVDVASGSVTTLVPGNGEGLVVIDISPEGDRVLFSKDDGLWSVEADGSHLQLLISDTVLSGDWQSVLPGLEPTGTPVPAVSPEPAPTVTASPGARALESRSPSTRRLSHLAYAVDGDIFVADWDGQDPVRIADGLPGARVGCGSAGYWAEGPMWSPDGRYLAYRSPRSQVVCDEPEADAFKKVLISDPEGHVVAEFPGVGWLIPWSPDSTRVATWLDSYTTIGVYGLDGVRQAMLSVPPGTEPAGDVDPVWSPDGASLLVPLMRPDGSRLVWELPLDGGPPRPVPADDPQVHWLVRRSPDGARVAYIDDVGVAASRTALVVSTDDGSQPRELADDINDWWGAPPFVWSPSGDRIVFVADGMGAVRPNDPTTMELRIVDVASGSVSTLVPANGDGVSVIAFSPAGDRILFSRYDADGAKLSLWSVGADGSDLHRLVDGTVTGDWQ